MSEHQAVVKVEEWQADYIVTLVMCANSASLSLYRYTANGTESHRVTTTTAIDLRLVDLVTQMVARLAQAEQGALL